LAVSGQNQSHVVEDDQKVEHRLAPFRVDGCPAQSQHGGTTTFTYGSEEILSVIIRKNALPTVCHAGTNNERQWGVNRGALCGGGFQIAPFEVLNSVFLSTL
jgi:hypothetical protein